MPEKPPASPERPEVLRANRRLDSWKEIAAYLQRDVTTARRWEKHEGLPVHRHLHNKLGSVYAYTQELDAWHRTRRQRTGSVDAERFDQGEGPAVGATASLTRGYSRRMLIGAVGLTLIVGLSYLAIRQLQSLDRRGGVESLAVLPFENISGDVGNEYFSDGITENLISRLSRLRGVRVISRLSVFRYKGRSVDAVQVGRELDVGAVLRGRFQQLNGTVSLSVEIVDSRSGRQLWSTRYDRDTSDLLALQEQLARDVARSLGQRAVADNANGAATSATGKLDAYRFYLRGVYYWNKRTEKGFQEALMNFTRSIDEDPTYALAYSGLADTYAMMGYYRLFSKHDANQKAQAAATKALQIDPNLAEAHASLAGAKLEQWDWIAVERGYRRAIELNPNYATVRHWYSNYLSLMGRHDEAIVEAKLAVRLDPLSPIVRSGALANAYLRAGQYDRAIAELQDTLRADATFANARITLGLAFARKGLYRDAIRELQSVPHLTPNWRAYLGQVHAKIGDMDEARKILQEVQNDQSAVSLVSVAGIYAALDEVEPALALLEEAYATRDMALLEMTLLPAFDDLRHYRRFQKLLHGMRPVS